MVTYLTPSQANTSWLFASRALLIPWKTPGGDREPTGIKAPVPASGSVSFNISSIAGDLYVYGAYDWTNPRIDGAAAECFWIAPGNTLAAALPPITMDRPAIIRNPQRGARLTLDVTRKGGTTLHVDKLVMPPYPEPLPHIGPAGEPDEWEMPFTSEAELFAWLGPGNVGGSPWAYNPVFGIDPDFGFPYLEITVPPTRELGVALFRNFSPRDEVHSRFCVMPLGSLWVGNRVGCKLPGPIDRGNDRGSEGLGWRMWHGEADRANPGVVRLTDYEYSALVPNWPAAPDIDAYLHWRMWNCIEQDARLNRPGFADGYEQIHLNGHLIVDDQAKVWRTDARQWDCFHFDYWHGGQRVYPASAYQLRFAKVGMSRSKRVGNVAAFLQQPSPPPEPLPMATIDSMNDDARKLYNDSCTLANRPTIEQQIEAAVAGSAATITALQNKIAAARAQAQAEKDADAAHTAGQSVLDALA